MSYTMWRAVLLAVLLGTGTAKAPAWTTPQNVTNQPSGSRAFGPRLAVDGVGNTHLVWAGGADPSTSWRAWYQSFNGTIWSGATALAGANANRPDIAVDGVGTVHAVYEEAAEDNIWYRKKPSGGAWTAPVNLKTGGRSIAASVAVNAAGDRIIVAWHEDNLTGGEWDILVNIYDGAAWSGTYNISTDSAVSTFPKTAIDPVGNMHVAWNSGSDIRYRKCTAAGAWNSATTIRHTATRIGVNSLAASADGQIHCLFTEDDTQGWEVFYAYHNGAAWSTPVNISNHPGTSDDIDGCIFVDGYNRLFAAWHDYSTIYYSWAPTSTSAWSPRQAIVSGMYLATAPEIVLDSVLTARVAWQSRPTGDDNWNVYVSSQAIGPPGPMGTIAGTVRDAYGYAVANATVSAGAYQIASAADGTYTLVNVAAGTYSVAASKAYFVTQTVPNISVFQNQTTIVDFTIAALPPSPVTSLTATPSNKTNLLRWTNPSSSNFTGTLILFKATGYPTGPADGTLVVDMAGSPGANQSYPHSGLTVGQMYYYAAFAHNDRPVPNYASGVNASAMPLCPADFGGDGDVDLTDFALFQMCFNGPNRPAALSTGCQPPDFDIDGDVDLTDFAAFQACFNGPNRPAVLGCVP